LRTYLGSAAVQALDVGTRLPKVVSVVEDLFVAASRLVLNIIQRTDLAFGFDVYLLRRDLKEKATGHITIIPFLTKSLLISD